MYFQGTIKKKVVFEGVGIHNGEKVKATLLPAPVNTGIVFHPAGKDTLPALEADKGVLAHIKNLLFTNNALTIGRDGFSVQTIEHFMAAFHVMDVTNLIVLVEGGELPILDGSCRDILLKLQETGVAPQNAFQEVFYIPYPIWIESGGSYLIALPGEDYKVTYTIDFSSKSHAVGTQTANYVIEKDTFIEALSSARTFGFYEEVEAMRRNGLARGGSLDNTLVFTRDGVLNGGLRYADECVRHKILDLVGDLSLLGCKLRGHFLAHKAGHRLDMELAKRIGRVMMRTRTAANLSNQVLRRREQEFSRFKKKLNLA